MCRAAYGLLVLEDAASSTTNNAGDGSEQIADSMSDLANNTIYCILGTAHNVVGHLFDTTDETVGRVLDLGHGRGGIVDEATDGASNVTPRNELAAFFMRSFSFSRGSAHVGVRNGVRTKRGAAVAAATKRTMTPANFMLKDVRSCSSRMSV